MSLYFDVYFWNWTNPDEFLQTENSDEINVPKFTQLGPYRFKETRDKEDVTFHERDSTVTYNPISYYYFDAEGSNGTLDDVIVNINIVAIGAAGQSINMEYKKRKVISMGLNSYEEYVTVAKTARELLFEGYEDDMVLAGKEGIVEDFNPEDIPFDRIGWFYKVSKFSFPSNQCKFYQKSKVFTLIFFRETQHQSLQVLTEFTQAKMIFQNWDQSRASMKRNLMNFTVENVHDSKAQLVSCFHLIYHQTQ